MVESRYYHLRADRESGRIVSLVDKDTGRELLDPDAPHGLGELVVRGPEGVLPAGTVGQCRRGASGPAYQSLEREMSAPGHPHVRQTVRLWEDAKRVDLAVRILKDPTPLLDAWLAFPFLAPSPEFRYEGVLSAMAPIADYLPGAYWDAVTVQHWVQVCGGGGHVLWSSLDAPVASLGALSAGYTSPAHSGRVPERAHHAPAGAEQLARGWVYSLLFHNNFATNFAVSQAGSVLFRYTLASGLGSLSDAEAARLGLEAVTPCETIFAERRRPGHLPLSASLLGLRGDPLVLLARKQAEDGRGWILRFWNPSPAPAETRVDVGLARIQQVIATSVVEKDSEAPAGGGEVGDVEETGFRLRVGARALVTVRVLPG